VDPEQVCVARAVCTALHMRRAFRAINAAWKQGWVPAFRAVRSEWLRFDLGIGIDFGPVLKQQVGPTWRSQYTVFGEHVNTAKRLEELACREAAEVPTGGPRAGILVSATVHSRLEQIRARGVDGDSPLVRYVDQGPVALKGSAHLQEVWGIPDDPGVPARNYYECCDISGCLLCAQAKGPS